MVIGAVLIIMVSIFFLCLAIKALVYLMSLIKYAVKSPKTEFTGLPSTYFDNCPSVDNYMRANDVNGNFVGWYDKSTGVVVDITKTNVVVPSVRTKQY